VAHQEEATAVTLNEDEYMLEKAARLDPFSKIQAVVL